MAESLVYKLREIDRVADFIGLDKPGLSRNVMEEYRQKYWLVNSAIRGEMTFSAVADEATRRDRGIRLFLPQFRNPAYDARMEDLQIEEIFGLPMSDSRIDELLSQHGRATAITKRISDYILNPPAMAAIMTAAFPLGLKALMPENDHITDLAVYTTGTFAGTIMGLLGPVIRSAARDGVLSSGKYLDKKVEQLYR